MSVPAAWPLVIAAVTTLAEASLTGVRVTRGRDTTNELGDFVMVGVDNIAAVQGWDSAGTFDQEFQTFGGARVETGSVHVLALSRTGDSGESAADTACTAVFALVTELVAAVRNDKTLGITSLDYFVAEVQTGAVNESENSEGAMASLPLTIHYQARI